jgi:hypothetical protein
MAFQLILSYHCNDDGCRLFFFFYIFKFFFIKITDVFARCIMYKTYKELGCSRTTMTDRAIVAVALESTHRFLTE